MQANILVVDDEESIRYTFKEFLLEQGYGVATAESPEQALRLCAGTEFDLVFSDSAGQRQRG